MRAIKRISIKGKPSKDVINKDMREISILIQFQHPNVVKYFEFFADDNYLFIVTEYCEVKHF